MSTDELTVPLRGGMPTSLTPRLLDRLIAGATARLGAERVTTLAPYTQVPIADLPMATPDDVIAAFETARRAQRQWRDTPIREREAVILRFHDLVLARQDEVLDLIQVENGKTRRDAFLEVGDVVLTSRYYGRTARALLKPVRRRGAFPLLTHTTELRHPKGVVGIVSPWNYPFSLAAGDTIPALLAGNGVVQKPDTQTALTALWAAKLMDEAGLPKGLWQIVLGSGRTIGSTLMDNADYMMFTGSTATGRAIAADAGRRLIGASLELGGKNALIVLDDANLDRAVDGAVRGAFSSSGQLCISFERMYVHSGIYDDFVTRFTERVKALRLGTAYDYSCHVGSLTSISQLDAVVDHVGDAIAKGATVLAGGKARPDVGPLFHEPTVLADVTPGMSLYRDETFGPVVSVYPFGDDDEAVALANDTVYGLNASVWTRDGARGRALAARLHAGTVNVNEAFAAAWGSLDAPMGGMGDSGLGRRHGAEGLLKYTEAQTVAQQRLLGFAPPGDMPYGTWVKALTAVLKLMKRSGVK